MGRLVRLWKDSEDEDRVIYRYGRTFEESGELTIDKRSGAIDGTPVPGYSRDDSWFAYGMLANSLAEKMFKENEYPDEASRAT